MVSCTIVEQSYMYICIVQVRLGRPAEEEPRVLDLVRPGEAETGNVCDIVVRENITIRLEINVIIYQQYISDLTFRSVNIRMVSNPNID